ncbi:LPXTG cell wall anchor domain-containing protein [Streptomyces sp. CC77]|uniref:LPXTG cell wall anchor domain-containing protein n=1 Tax=Streptomyces sp. CC77 TaxID=1906739 RepID=UPI0008DE1A5D|nr:LPXTG cell wall anchor domain-containing protein [Streptomyces sp. CC77]OII59829.1 hypothetical protein BJP39_11375 [Streptomyces sp. CC77]
MKIRRTLATAVALAVTAPVTVLAASPAFATTGPAAETTAVAASKEAGKPSLADLEKAVAAAQAALTAAEAAKAEAVKGVEAAVADDAPLKLALNQAVAAVEKAAAEKAAADKAVTEAQAAIDALPEDASDDDRVAAVKALAAAQAAAQAAADAKTAADTAKEAAHKALDDDRVAATRKLHEADTALDKAKADLAAAQKALEDAKKDTGEPKPDPKPDPKPGDDDDDDMCDTVSKVKVSLHGVPGKIAAGSTVHFSMKVTNDSKRTLDEVDPFAAAFAEDRTASANDISHLLKLQWSNGSAWKNVGPDFTTGTITGLKAGVSKDVKLRLTVDAKAPAGMGVAVAAGGYYNEDGTCGFTPEGVTKEFEIVAAGTKVGNEPAKSGKPMPLPQGGTSTTPVSATTSTGTVTGQLAKTGSNDAVPQIALAGGVAVALGAGAMFVVRRRKAGAGA